MASSRIYGDGVDAVSPNLYNGVYELASSSKSYNVPLPVQYTTTSPVRQI